MLLGNASNCKSSMEHIPRAVAVAQCANYRAGLNVASYVHVVKRMLLCPVADPERLQGFHGTPLSAKNSPHLPTKALQLKR